ncbi:MULTISPECIES: hypothetical protein [Paenibacillus]|uniref:Uncharacterized protein n=1 Tax=Paenibacillus vandeheii TaxID=3035917 RepID=A0ABT8JHK9_9BACL|nr:MULTISPECIES: hypothetical protein [Paenibacillus]KGP77357.1 hypothetical protein P363_0133525 [Paenibacillus sp. MAEPY1]KGP78414.1 hypothetical protein P364_0128640 [Paenibacillus sp. MAEPY2]MDN4604036.1 hypothetical protein [Paenibacillus vandeheii]
MKKCPFCEVLIKQSVCHVCGRNFKKSKAVNNPDLGTEVEIEGSPIEGDIILVDGKNYFLYVESHYYWSTYLLKKNLKRDMRSDIVALSAEDVARGVILNRGVTLDKI